MSGRQVILIRHGAVADRWRRRCYGVTDVPLSQLGREQSEEVASAVAALGPDAVWSSPRSRTRALAERLAALTSLAPTVDQRLAERSFGAWEQLAWDTIWAASGAAMMGLVEQPDSFAPPGGETTAALRDRVMAWWADLPATGCLVAVSHAGPIAALRGSLAGLPVADWLALAPGLGEAIVIGGAGGPGEALFPPA